MSQNSDSLGEIRHTFRPQMANIGAGAVIGFVLLVGGLAIAFFLARRHDPIAQGTGDNIAKYALIGLFGVIAPVGGIALLVYMKRLASHQVVVHDNGFTYVYAGVTDICLWTDVEKINEVLTEEQLKVLKVPGAAIKNTDRSFAIHRKDGKDFDFTVNTIDSIPRLAKCLKQASAKFGIPWERIVQ